MEQTTRQFAHEDTGHGTSRIRKQRTAIYKMSRFVLSDKLPPAKVFLKVHHIPQQRQQLDNLGSSMSTFREHFTLNTTGS